MGLETEREKCPSCGYVQDVKIQPELREKFTRNNECPNCKTRFAVTEERILYVLYGCNGYRFRR